MVTAVKREKLPPTIDSEPIDGAVFDNVTGIPDIEFPDAPKSKRETDLICASLAKSYAMLAQFVMLFDMEDAAIIARNIDSLVESWRQLLDDDAKMRKRMMALVKSSGWGAVISAHIVVALPIAVHHKDHFGHLFNQNNSAE
jgi:hypothetical protein